MVTHFETHVAIGGLVLNFFKLRGGGGCLGRGGFCMMRGKVY